MFEYDSRITLILFFLFLLMILRRAFLNKNSAPATAATNKSAKKPAAAAKSSSPAAKSSAPAKASASAKAATPASASAAKAAAPGKTKQFNAIQTEVLEVLDVHDGDTFKCTVKNHELMAVYGFVSIRCHGYDSQEVSDKRAAVKAQANNAKAFLKRELEKSERILLNIVCLDKYGGRFVAIVTLVQGGKKIDLTKLMIQKTGAKPYDGGTKEGFQ